MKKSNLFLAGALCMLASCSTQEFADKDQSVSLDRINEYTLSWIEHFGTFDANHTWSTLGAVQTDVAAGLNARIYNGDPSEGGHLIGVVNNGHNVTLSLGLDATSVYAELTDNDGSQVAEGTFAVTDGKVILDAASAMKAASRSAHVFPYFDAMVAFEDLGGIGDYDFNDVVLGLKYVAGSTTLQIKPMAAGGTLPTNVYFNGTKLGEIHDMLQPGSSTSDMLNTEKYEIEAELIDVTVSADFVLADGWKNISLKVEDKDGTIEITALNRENTAPQMFCIAGDWFWPKETKAIDFSYDKFEDWTTNPLEYNWAYRYSSINNVVPWNKPDEETGDWLLGITKDGSDFEILLKPYEEYFHGRTAVQNNKRYYFGEEITTLYELFYNQDNLTSVNVAASHFHTSNVTDFSKVFYSCGSLESLNLSNWDTSKATTFAGMFTGCGSLKNVDFTGWDTGNVTDMSNMFLNCSNLNEIDLSHFDTSKVTNMASMFTECHLNDAHFVEGWDVSSVKDMRDLFIGGQFSEIDLSRWNTASLENTSQMFGYCVNIETLDLSTFDTSNLKDASFMVYHCNGLKAIDLSGWKISENNVNVEHMFQFCDNDLEITCSAATRYYLIHHTSDLPGDLKSEESTHWHIVD